MYFRLSFFQIPHVFPSIKFSFSTIITFCLIRIVRLTLFPAFLVSSMAVYPFFSPFHPFVLHVPCQHQDVVFFSVVVVCPSRFRVYPFPIAGLLLFTRTHTPLIPAVSPTTATLLPDSLAGRSPFPGFSQAHPAPAAFCCHRKAFHPPPFFVHRLSSATHPSGPFPPATPVLF
jgi:hypothetical protein